mmetsp:Transcript_40512/g.46448  ORF Transcript_40512/g.46448 Transcript_40512/m.46448 type:complete len:229 (+) Transcript_40512:307-993(+)
MVHNIRVYILQEVNEVISLSIEIISGTLVSLTASINRQTHSEHTSAPLGSGIASSISSIEERFVLHEALLILRNFLQFCVNLVLSGSRVEPSRESQSRLTGTISLTLCPAQILVIRIFLNRLFNSADSVQGLGGDNRIPTSMVQDIQGPKIASLNSKWQFRIANFIFTNIFDTDLEGIVPDGTLVIPNKVFTIIVFIDFEHHGSECQHDEQKHGHDSNTSAGMVGEEV